jgi:hypothetical protein
MMNGGGPLRGRVRRRWLVVGGVVACWLALVLLTGSAAAAFVILVVTALVGVVITVGLRALGITKDHPFFRRLGTRPWRGGRDVLNVALAHLSDVLVVTPSGSLYAPDTFTVALHPGDLSSLCESIDFDALSVSVTEAYVNQVAKRGARFAGQSQPWVYLVGDGSLPQGRYRLHRGVPSAAYPAPPAAPVPGNQVPGNQVPGNPVPDEAATRQFSGEKTRMDGNATVIERVRPAVPELRLVTGSAVARTTRSGAQAGRAAVELQLPDVPTVSRVHATFDFTGGCWWVTNQGANGLCVNGSLVTDQHPLNDGDQIRWGRADEAPTSRVEIG